MKLMVVSVVSFLIGIFSSVVYLSDEIESQKIEIKKMVNLTLDYADKLSEQRIVDKLDNQISYLEHFVAREKDGAPVRIMAVDLADDTQKIIDDISTEVGEFKNSELKDKAKKLVEKGNRVIADIEFLYK